MTKEREALKMARDWIAERPADRPVSAGKMISIIDRALAQPDEFKQGRQKGMKQERALWELSKLGQKIEACQYAVDVAMPEYRCVGKCQYAAPPQRPWVGLTEVDILAESKHWKNPEDFMDGVYWAETTLKEKNNAV